MSLTDLKDELISTKTLYLAAQIKARNFKLNERALISLLNALLGFSQFQQTSNKQIKDLKKKIQDELENKSDPEKIVELTKQIELIKSEHVKSYMQSSRLSAQITRLDKKIHKLEHIDRKPIKKRKLLDIDDQQLDNIVLGQGQIFDDSINGIAIAGILDNSIDGIAIAGILNNSIAGIAIAGILDDAIAGILDDAIAGILKLNGK